MGGGGVSSYRAPYMETPSAQFGFEAALAGPVDDFAWPLLSWVPSCHHVDRFSRFPGPGPSFDALYELAAEVPFDGGLNVVPWDHVQGHEPWLLKMHGDLDRGNLVFTRSQYQRFMTEDRALGALLQALLITRHLIFVGYSLRDSNFIQLAEEVANVLPANPVDPHLGTIIAVTPAAHEDGRLGPALEFVRVGDETSEVSKTDARNLEIFLDRMAWAASRDEASWLLDVRCASLLSSRDRELASDLRSLPLREDGR